MTETINIMKVLGDPAAGKIFLRLVDDHDMELLGSEAEALREELGNSGTDVPGTGPSGADDGSGGWCIAAVKVSDWNQDLTPWKAGPVFGKQGFGDGAERTLRKVLDEVIPELEEKHRKTGDVPEYYLAGYSLAGLFALWAAYQTDRFSGIVAASPSVWYPDWIAYASEHQVKAPKIYLSIGDKEEKTRNPVMASVGNAIREQYRILSEAGIRTQLDYNPGNHFKDSDRRVARGMAWMMGER